MYTEQLEYHENGKPFYYRLGHHRFTGIVPAENHKIDERDRRPIELFYKGRWWLTGDVPEPRPVAGI